MQITFVELCVFFTKCLAYFSRWKIFDIRKNSFFENVSLLLTGDLVPFIKC